MQSFSLNKYLKPVALIVFLLAALAAGVYLSKQRYIKPQAAPGQPDISFSTNPAINPNSNFDLIIQVSPNGASFYAYEFAFTFDTSKVGLQDTTTVENNFVKSTDTTFMYPIVEGNKITITGAKTNTPYPTSGTYELVKVKMKGLPGASGQINFTWDNSSTIADTIINKTNGNFTVGGSGATVTTTPTQDQASLFFSSSKTAYSPGENLDLVLNLNSANKAVSSLNFVFSYNDSAVEFQNTTGDLAQNIVIDPNSGFDTANAIKTIDTNNKTIRVLLASGTKPNVTGNKTLATVKFKVKSNTTSQNTTFITDKTASLIYDANIQNILGQTPSYQINIVTLPLTPPVNAVKVGTITFKAKSGVTGDARIDFSTIKESFVTELGGGDILGQITGIIIKIISGGNITPTPDPNAPNISFKVKFRSVSNESGNSNPNQNVKLKAKGNGFFTEYTVPVVHIGDGVYLATDINLAGHQTLNGVTFFVKGPKHLQKEVGTGQSGVIIDWTATQLEGGDTVPQDGIVNSVDISRILELLSVPNQSQQQLLVGDLNYDGIVNGADVNELILTLSTKRDED